MRPVIVSLGTGATRGTQSGADSEDDRGGESHQRQQDGGPGQQSRRETGYERGYWRVDGVHKTQPTAHETARQDEADDTGAKSNK
jgi:hypothetical protein